jgi:hypothetical protein
MRTTRAVTTLIGAVVALATACSGSGGTPTPSAAPSATAPAPTSSTTPATPTPAPSLTAVSARVTFDGKACAYTGPTVIPFPASLTVEYAPTPAEEGSFVGLMAIHSGTTGAELDDPGNPDIGVGTPSFVYLETHAFGQGSSTFEYRAVDSGLNPMAEMTLHGKPYDTFMVVCVPEIPGRPAGGYTILHVVESGT